MSTTRPTRLQRAGHDDDSPTHYLIGAHRGTLAHHAPTRQFDSPHVTDGGTITHPMWTDLTAFEGNVLYAITRLERDDALTYGLAIRDVLEDYYTKPINHGRLYPTLDDLAEQGLITKTSVDDRTNEYELTDAGYELLRRRRDELTAVLTEEDQ